MGSTHDDELSGYLHLKVNSISTPKVKAGKRWIVLRKEKNQLECYKSQKDIGERGPLETLPLFGAGISFGNSDGNEFLINIRGLEYSLSAESHRGMMKWMSVLQEQIKVRPSSSHFESSLEMVVEDQPLELEEKEETKPKRLGFFQRLFGQRFRFKSSTKSRGTPQTQSKVENRTVQAAHLRTVVGSMQDISAKAVTCKNCNLLDGRNSYLNEQVLKLTEEIDNLKEECRKSGKKYTLIEKDHLILKREFVEFLLNVLMQDDELYSCMNDIPCFKQVVDLLNNEMEQNNNVPILTANGFSEPHKDYLGFIHGNTESPLQLLLYACDILKRRYMKYFQEADDVYQQWKQFARTLPSQPDLENNSVLEELIVYGIPHEVRGAVWKWLINQRVKPIKDEKGGSYYEELLAKLPHLQGAEDDDADSPIEKQIKIDLLRTMPTHEDYQTLDGGKVPTMHRILRAFLIHNPDVGYCQGMNFMVGFALLYLDEEACFWLLVAVTEVFFSKHHYNTYLTGTQANQRVFQEICNKEAPLIMKHLESKNCELGPVTFNWFMTIFIDSLTIQVVLNIWDCFLVYGHTILYKFALSILKLQKKAILKEKDSLAIMRALKKFGKTFYNAEGLLKDVFATSLSEPMEHYLSVYESYAMEIQEESNKRKEDDEQYEREKEKLKYTPKPMMVSVADSLDELDDDLIIKCAQCEENRNFVWLCCSSDLIGQIFVLNVSSKKILPISWEVDSRCIAMERIPKLNVMLVSTMKSYIHAIDVETREELWKMQLAGSALSISCGPSGNVAFSLIDGSIAFLNIQNKENHQLVPTYIDVSRAPVFCGCIVDQSYWCGAANKIVLINLRTLEMTTTLQVCPNERHVVNKLVSSDNGIWNSLERCSVVHLWHKTKYYCLLSVDVLDACGLSHEKKAPSNSSTVITTIMALKKTFWVGFGNGRFIICDICKENNPEDDVDQAFNIYKSSMENLTVIEHKNAAHTMRKSSSRLGIATCCHDMDDESRYSGSYQSADSTDDVTEYVMVDKKMPKHCDDDGMILTLKMSQIQRVCEQSVTSFIPCRNDGKLILSCMGALNDDSSVILWSSQNQDGRQMWFAQTVSYSE